MNPYSSKQKQFGACAVLISHVRASGARLKRTPKEKLGISCPKKRPRSSYRSILHITTMAKSLRSKWKRKMKAEKRVRYGQKERDRLEKMLASYEAEEKERQEQKEKEVMEHDPQVLGEALTLLKLITRCLHI